MLVKELKLQWLHSQHFTISGLLILKSQISINLIWLNSLHFLLQGTTGMVLINKAITGLVTIAMVTISLVTVAMVTTTKALIKRMNRTSLGDMTFMVLI